MIRMIPKSFLLIPLTMLVSMDVAVAALPISADLAFISSPSRARQGSHAIAHPNFTLRILSASASKYFEDDDFEDDEEEAVEPGQMRVSEIRSELEMRGIDFTDCFDKEALVGRLEEARATGKADPEILNEFNKQKLEETFQEKKTEVEEEVIEQVVANDGTLPGGMSPDMLKKLMSNPEIMTLLQSTKMQDAMKLMMTGGREDLENAMKADPEMQELVSKLSSVLQSVQ